VITAVREAGSRPRVRPCRRRRRSPSPSTSLTAGLEEILELFLTNTDEHYYVVDDEGRLAGAISIHDVKEILHEEALGKVLIADDLCRPVAEVVHRLDNLEDCLIALGHRDTSDLPVLYSPEHPVLVGVVTRQAIFEVYNREVLQQRDAGIQLITGEARLHDCVELPEEYKVQLLTPPDAWYGRTLRDLELRPDYGISVLAGETTTFDMALTSRAVQLNSVTVTVSRGTEEKETEAAATVHTVGEVEIQERSATTPADYLRSAPGVDVVTHGLQANNVVVRGFNNIFSGALHVLTDNRLAGVPSLRNP